MKKFLFALAIIAAAACQHNAATPATVELIPMDEMQYGDASRTGEPFAKAPTVLRNGDRYLMYYSITSYTGDMVPEAATPERKGWHSGIAESRDLVHWFRVGELDLRDTKGNPIWGGVAPCVKVIDGQIHMFYQRRWGPAHNNNNIWHAVSKDGITFTNTFDEPIIVPSTKWSIDRSIDAEVYRVGNKMILMFATRETTQTVQMLGMAEAPYGSDYGPDKWTLLSVDEPFFKPDFPWEQHCIEAPTVIKHKGLWYMFYAGAYNHELQMIGLATSKDGYNYQRIEPNGLLYTNGAPGTWNAGESGHPGVFQDEDGSVWLFYQGKATKDGNYNLSVCKVLFH